MTMTREQAAELAKGCALGWRAINSVKPSYLLDANKPDWKPHDWVIEAVMTAGNQAEPTEAQRQAIIAEFLERSGQWLTNEATHAAAIADTPRMDWLEAHLMEIYAMHESKDEGIKSVYFDSEMGGTLREWIDATGKATV